MSANKQFNLDLSKTQQFLSKNFPEISGWQIEKIAGDASFRSYYRINCSDLGWKTKILMFAPPQFERTDHFILVDEFLISLGLSAPKILARDENQGFLLLEDFGDLSFSKILAGKPEIESKIYKDAVDVLLFLQNFSPPKIEVPPYNSEILFGEVSLFVEWYLPFIGKKPDNYWRDKFKIFWFELFDKLSKDNQVLVLRDYHVDNLMILDGKNGRDSVGLLDFQDALIGSSAYDLVSLLEDARRDVGELTKKEIFDYFVSGSNFAKNPSGDKFIKNFNVDYQILSLQRNLKILGIFARLSIRDGKNNYLQFLPRVKKLVLNRLQQESLFNDFFRKMISEIL